MEERDCISFDDIGEIIGAISHRTLGVCAYSVGKAGRENLRNVKEMIIKAAHPFYADPELISDAVLGNADSIRLMALEDSEAIFLSDPAAHGTEEIMACYPGFFAVFCHRIASVIYTAGAPVLARMISEYAHMLTGIDIHPGARIGRAFAVDHGTGIVIGETAYVGNNVKMYHGVTLGALSLPRDDGGKILRGVKRHPSVMDNCIICANATILGGNTVIGEGSIIGAGCFVDCSLPRGTKYINPQSCRHRDIFP